MKSERARTEKERGRGTEEGSKGIYLEEKMEVGREKVNVCTGGRTDGQEHVQLTQ